MGTLQSSKHRDSPICLSVFICQFVYVRLCLSVCLSVNEQSTTVATAAGLGVQELRVLKGRMEMFRNEMEPRVMEVQRTKQQHTCISSAAMASGNKGRAAVPLTDGNGMRASQELSEKKPMRTLRPRAAGRRKEHSVTLSSLRAGRAPDPIELTN